MLPDGQLPGEPAAVGDDPGQRLPLPRLAAHGRGPWRRTGRGWTGTAAFPGWSAPRAAARRRCAPGSRARRARPVTRTGPQHDRGVQQGRLDQRYRPPAHASHGHHSLPLGRQRHALTLTILVTRLRPLDSARSPASFRASACDRSRPMGRARTGHGVTPARGGRRRAPGRPRARARGQHRHAVPDPAGGTGQVDDEHAPGQPGDAAGQDRGRDPGRGPAGPDRLGDPGISRSSTRRVISGVRSPGVSPVPPVVTTTS